MEAPDAKEKIAAALKELTYQSEGADILKFLTDMFDALFGILDEYPDLSDVSTGVFFSICLHPNVDRDWHKLAY